MSQTIAIIGAGNLGTSIAKGLLKTQFISPNQLYLTRRHTKHLIEFKELGCRVTTDNKEAVSHSSIIILAVEPQQCSHVLKEICESVEKEHLLISVVTGVTIQTIEKELVVKPTLVRAMPNTAIAQQKSMTCLSTNQSTERTTEAEALFNKLGETEWIDESMMTAATALTACGVAFFLRAIRAASQGGIEIGFSSSRAIKLAAQTALGAASLLLENDTHPEREIDRVTTPMGCTITGLNQLEHGGFSSSMIKGIITSAEKAKDLGS